MRGWIKRHRRASGVLGVTVVVLLVRLVWGWHAGQLLEAEMAPVRERGDPLAAAEIPAALLPDDQNAAVLYAEAAKVIQASEEQDIRPPTETSLEFDSSPPYRGEWHVYAAASERSNEAALRLARQARTVPNSRLILRFPTPIFKIGLKSLSHLRTIANVVTDGAQHVHLHLADDHEAIERLRDTLHLADAVRQDPVFIHQLVAMGIEALACDRLQIVGPGVRLEGDLPAATGGRPATRAQIQAVIKHLLEERPTRDGLVAAMQVERVFAIDMHQYVAEGTWAIRPLVDLEIARALRNIELAIRAVGQANVPAAVEVLQGIVKEPLPQNALLPFGSEAPEAPPRYSRWFSQADFGDIATSIPERALFWQLAERRMTIVSLAVRLYRADHSTWPERLDDLVPTYLPAVPVDPFRSDGGPLGYVLLPNALPDRSERPLVFVESGDAENAIDSEPMHGWQSGRYDGKPRGKPMRQYRDLARWTPRVRRFDQTLNAQRAIWLRELMQAIEYKSQITGNPGEPDEPYDHVSPPSED